MGAEPFADVPLELREGKRWIVHGADPDSGKPKCPLMVRHPRKRASSTDAGTWASFEDALALLERQSPGVDGVGYVFTWDAGYIYIDIDDALDAAGELRAWARPYVEPLVGRTYIEFSPSGHGLHIIGRGRLPADLLASTDCGKSVEFPAEASQWAQEQTPPRRPEVAIYTQGKYTTITGMVWGANRQIVNGADAIAQVWRAAGLGRGTAPITATAGQPVAAGARHKYLLSVAARLRKAGVSGETVLSAVRAAYDHDCVHDPPKSDDELAKIAGWAHKAVDPAPEEPPPPESEYPPRPTAEVDATPTQPQVSPLTHVGRTIDASLALFKRRWTGEEKPLPLPWRQFSEVLGGGLWPGLHVITGPTGVGKSALAIQASLSAARAGHPILYVGLELDTAQIHARYLSHLMGTTLDGRVAAHWSSIYLGKVAPERITGAATALSSLPIYIEEAPPGGWSTSSLIPRVAEMKAAHPGMSPVVVVDFLQLVGQGEPGRHQELRERIGAAAYMARECARKHGAIVICLSSISRSGATEISGLSKGCKLGQGDPGDLVGLGKESGDIEFSADTVLTLAREPREEGQPETKIWGAVAKQRAGPPAWVLFSFNGSWLSEVGDKERDRHVTERRSALDAEKETKDARDIERISQSILEALAGGPMSTRAIRTEVSGRDATKDAALSELARKKQISRNGPPVGGSATWQLCQACPGVAECGPEPLGHRGGE